MKARARRLQKLVLIIGIVLCYIGFQKLFPIGCPFKYFLHIPCAGCGMTRAWQNVMMGDFNKAFYYHPMYFSIPLIVGMIIFSDVFPKGVRMYFWYIIASLFALIYGIRIIVHSAAIF